jgi:DNA-binding response OmpR family regulator
MAAWALLPAATCNGTASNTCESIRPHGAKLVRILVVDDDANVGEALGALFGQGGHSVRWCADGHAALAMAAAEPPDVVLLDLCLADGLSLSFLPRLGWARVYVITANRPSRYIRHMAESGGALAVLDKSIDPAELLRRVEQGP